ncbi:MAG: hypothetical protein KJ583_04450 [Nanoarchaeota archaeon]|nr:hypothetical protein [Nanoarchaeota archaeon]MBU1604542.1 hypothetical protein [Nanoarchaeota archaeon]
MSGLDTDMYTTITEIDNSFLVETYLVVENSSVNIFEDLLVAVNNPYQGFENFRYPFFIPANESVVILIDSFEIDKLSPEKNYMISVNSKNINLLHKQFINTGFKEMNADVLLCINNECGKIVGLVGDNLSVSIKKPLGTVAKIFLISPLNESFLLKNHSKHVLSNKGLYIFNVTVSGQPYLTFNQQLFINVLEKQAVFEVFNNSCGNDVCDSDESEYSCPIDCLKVAQETDLSLNKSSEQTGGPTGNVSTIKNFENNKFEKKRDLKILAIIIFTGIMIVLFFKIKSSRK